LFVTPFFYPEKISSGKYNTELVRELAKNAGMHVRCSHPFYPDWIPKQSSAELSNVRIMRGGAWVRYPQSNVLKRLILEAWFCLFVIPELWRGRSRYSAIVLIFPPVLAGVFMRWLIPRQVPVIGIVHDVLGVMAKCQDNMIRDAVARTMSTIERMAFAQCDRLIALSRGMRDFLVEEYRLDARRVAVHYAFTTLDLDSYQHKSIDVLHGEMKHVVYSGALGEKQVPDLLFEVMAKLVALRGDVICDIFSSGPLFERLRTNARSLERVRFHPLVEEEDLAGLYAGSAVQIIPQAAHTGSGAFPSKLPNVVASGAPVFVICDDDSELAVTLRKLRCAKSTPSRDPQSIAVSLSDFIDEVQLIDHGRCRASNSEILRREFAVGPLAAEIIRVFG